MIGLSRVIVYEYGKYDYGSHSAIQDGIQNSCSGDHRGELDCSMVVIGKVATGKE